MYYFLLLYYLLLTIHFTTVRFFLASLWFHVHFILASSLQSLRNKFPTKRINTRTELNRTSPTILAHLPWWPKCARILSENRLSLVRVSMRRPTRASSCSFHSCLALWLGTAAGAADPPTALWILLEFRTADRSCVVYYLPRLSLNVWGGGIIINNNN